MSWLEGYVKEFPDSTPEDIIWAWMSKNYQATIGDEKILFDALSKLWVKYKMYDLEKSMFYHVKTVDKRFGLCYNTNQFGGSYEST